LKDILLISISGKNIFWNIGGERDIIINEETTKLNNLFEKNNENNLFEKNNENNYLSKNNENNYISKKNNLNEENNYLSIKLSTIKDIYISSDHKCLAWCKQLIEKLTNIIMKIINNKIIDNKSKILIYKNYLINNNFNFICFFFF
jgi:hypothetical protein